MEWWWVQNLVGQLETLVTSSLAKDLSLLRRLAIYPGYHPTKHAVVQRSRLGPNNAQEIMCSDVTPKLLDLMGSTELPKPLTMLEIYSPKRQDSGSRHSLPRHLQLI
jgi:hypothetical protein